MYKYHGISLIVSDFSVHERYSTTIKREVPDEITQIGLDLQIVALQIGSVPVTKLAESNMLQITSSKIMRAPLDVAAGP